MRTTSTITTAPSTTTGSGRRWASSADPYGNPFAPGWSLFFGGTGNSLFSAWARRQLRRNFATIYARNIVANVHIGIPHHNDAGRDDVQILYTDEALKNQIYLSGNDVASPFCTGAGRAERNGVHESD